MPKQPPYEPVRPVSANRAGNARRYMGNMAKAANNGMLASETLVGLQRPSQGLPEGVPAMVLRRDSEGVWYAAEWSEPDAVTSDCPAGQSDVNAAPVSSPIVNTAPVNSPDVNKPVSSGIPQPQPGQDRKAYMRDYMRAKRAKERGE